VHSAFRTLGHGRRTDFTVPIDLTKVLNGETNDFPLQPNDVLFVPANSGSRRKILTLATAVGIPLIPTLILTGGSLKFKSRQEETIWRN
jgi:hypothetical protein